MSDFQKWVVSGYPFPEHGAKLNCWEFVLVFLHLHNTLDKVKIQEEFQRANQAFEALARTSDGACLDMRQDQAVISTFLQVGDATTQEMDDMGLETMKLMEPGVIICFGEGSEDLGHVVLVLDKCRVLSMFHVHNSEDKQGPRVLKWARLCADLKPFTDNRRITNFKVVKSYSEYFQKLFALGYDPGADDPISQEPSWRTTAVVS